ncbi:MAC/perforin domain-containing protein [Sphingobacterium siyangense]|uniref:MAC/perforin domain-containing protein n=1 Tax=Sphingobacterium siyangense TaxID=459529 RepID=UPI002FDDD391
MKKYFIYIALLSLIVSCKQNDLFNDTVRQEQTEDIIFQARNSKLPGALSRSTKKKSTNQFNTQNTTSLPIDAYSGRGYTVGNGILGSVDNVRRQILDFNKLQTNGLIVKDPIKKTNIESFAFSDFQRYASWTNITKKVSAGFNLNLGLFSLGAKRTTTEKFSNNTMETSRSVSGQLNIEVRDAMYRMDLSPSSMRRIASGYMDSWFLDDLYNSTIVDVLNTYGPFVITGYYSGGRASATYYGTHKFSADSTNKEKDMQTDITASYKWGGKGDTTNSVSANFGFGRNTGNGSSFQSNIESASYIIETTGGAYDFQVRTPPTEIKNSNIDLSQWLSSLNNVSNHAFSGLADQGLNPISDFMLEANFKRRLQDTHLGYFNTNTFIEPFIEIVKVLVRTTGSGERLYDIAAVLNTRQGDKIILGKGSAATATDADLRANNTPSIFAAKSQALANEKMNFYQCLIKSNESTIILPFLRIPLSINIANVSESRMLKFYNTESDMWYIYDPVGLTAYSFYLDDYILEVYGMKDWFDTLQEKAISMTNLYQRYTIIGL